MYLCTVSVSHHLNELNKIKTVVVLFLGTEQQKLPM